MTHFNMEAIERSASKSNELEKIKMARKKHSNVDGGDEFGIELDTTVTKKRGRESNDRDASKKQKTEGRNADRTSNRDVNGKRASKNEKYGFGGGKRNIKSNDRKSTDDLDKFSVRKMKSGAKSGGAKKTARPGKDKRSSSRNKS